MDKKLIKLAVKHADKIDPSLVSSLNKAGLNVPGINPRNTPQNPTPSAPPYAKSTAQRLIHMSRAHLSLRTQHLHPPHIRMLP